MAAYEVLLLNTAIPQIQAAQSGDTYVVPRDIAFSTVASFAAGAEATPSIVATGDTNTGIWFPAADTVAISTGGISRMRLNSSGNLGLGVTPSAWLAGGGSNQWQAIEIPSGALQSQGTIVVGVMQNAFASSIGAFTYKTTAPASWSYQYNGEHYWANAASGTANTTFTFTERARISSDGTFRVKGAGAAGSTDAVQFSGSAPASSLLLDSSGNLGLGVTPSAWESAFRSLDMRTNGAGFSSSDDSASVNVNSYNNSGWKFKGTSIWRSSRYDQFDGTHAWQIGNTGNANDPITFTQAMTLNASGYLGIGETNPIYNVHVSGTNTVNNRTFSTSATGDALVGAQNNNGKLAGSLVYGSTKTAYGSIGADETAFYSNTSTTIMADGGSAVIKFAAGGNNEKARITSAGYFKASDDGVYGGGGSTFHEMNQSAAGQGVLVLYGDNASTTAAGMLFIETARNTTNNTYYAISYYNSGAAAYKFRVADSGDVTNTNGTYGTISDAKMKTDIVDAGSQWSDIKALRFRKFKMKDDPSGLVQLGVVAQEVELTSPGLVDEHADKDAEGNDLGTTTKSVKTSVLLMKAAVALQEAMARIETLEAEVAALKGA